MVPPRSEAIVSLVPLTLPDDQDFLFHPVTQANLTLFTHLVNHQTSKILVKNTSSQVLHILRRHKLGHLVNIAYKNCFLVNIHSAFDAVISPPLSEHLSDHNSSPFLLSTDPSLEIVLSNGVKVYGDATAVKQIAELVVEYITIWESHSFV